MTDEIVYEAGSPDLISKLIELETRDTNKRISGKGRLALRLFESERNVRVEIGELFVDNPKPDTTLVSDKSFVGSGLTIGIGSIETVKPDKIQAGLESCAVQEIDYLRSSSNGNGYNHTNFDVLAGKKIYYVAESPSTIVGGKIAPFVK